MKLAPGLIRTHTAGSVTMNRLKIHELYSL